MPPSPSRLTSDSGVLSSSWYLLIRGLILPAVRQKFHLAPCAKNRDHLCTRSLHPDCVPGQRFRSEDSHQESPPSACGSLLSVCGSSRGGGVRAIQTRDPADQWLSLGL